MTLIVWLIVWLILGADHVSFTEPNAWAVSLGICAFLELLDARN